jgi:hypothetical protein
MVTPKEQRGQTTMTAGQDTRATLYAFGGDGGDGDGGSDGSGGSGGAE